MERKRNIRVEKLMRTLRTAETMYFWKWLRTKYGIRQAGDARWLAMRPPDTSEDGTVTSSAHMPSPPELEECYEPEIECESRSKDYKARIYLHVVRRVSFLDP